MATRQAKGFPPNVDPCSPGLMVSITSSSHSTADTWWGGANDELDLLQLEFPLPGEAVLHKLSQRKPYRVDSSGQSFAQNHHVWADLLVVHGQPPAGPRQARLHLVVDPQDLDPNRSFSGVPPNPGCSSNGRFVPLTDGGSTNLFGLVDLFGDEAYVVFGAKLSDFGEVARIGNHHPGLPLDGLRHEGGDIWVLEGFLGKKGVNKRMISFVQSTCYSRSWLLESAYKVKQRQQIKLSYLSQALSQIRLSGRDNMKSTKRQSFFNRDNNLDHSQTKLIASL